MRYKEKRETERQKRKREKRDRKTQRETDRKRETDRQKEGKREGKREKEREREKREERIKRHPLPFPNTQLHKQRSPASTATPTQITATGLTLALWPSYQHFRTN